MAAAVLLACATEAPITAWDLATGTQLGAFKGNVCGRNRLCAVGHDYLAAAQSGKDAIHFWAWHKDQVLQRCFAQESLTALAASADGAYLAAGGSSGALYVWETASGRLLRSWPAHYKAVSCLAFSDGGGVLVSAGDDALVCAWLLAEVLDDGRDTPAAAAAAAMAAARVQPLHTWSEHTLPVTSVYLGLGEGSAVLVTASLDRCVKLWSLATGQLLRSVTLPAGVTAATLDAGEHVLLAGCTDGSIWEVGLAGQQQQQPQLPALGAGQAGGNAAGVIGGPGSCAYEGHTKAISSLAVTRDGEQLLSGCEDGSARVWDMRSRQCVRVLHSPSKAPISTALLSAWPAHLSGLAGQAAAGARQAPKRLQPLAPLAKYAGTAGPAKAWEGPPIVLDAAACAGCCSASAAATSLLPEPWPSPLAALQLPPAGQGAAPAAHELPHGGGEARQDEAAALRQQVEQLQQQLQESRAVAARWQQLHGELHEFAAEQVLSGPAR